MRDQKGIFLSAAKKFGTPLYVYEQSAIEARCEKLKRAFPGFSIHYAMKVNSNPSLLKVIGKTGLKVEAMSAGEIALAKAAGWKAKEIAFTSSNLTEQELISAAKEGVSMHLDSLTQLEQWGKNRLGSEVSLRLNQGVGAGAHAGWITGGDKSKFGIYVRDLDRAQAIADRYAIRITGIQQHIGSNILESDPFLKAAEVLLESARALPYVTRTDFGGGFGIPYKPEDTELPLQAVGKGIRALVRAFEKETGRSLSCAIEPGRYVVADSGTLLVHVVDTKETEAHTFAGVNSGFNHLVRPVMYGAYHEIENISRAKGPVRPISVAGNLCESGDIFAWDRPMRAPRIGDILAIRTAGSCGFSMASYFNMRSVPREALISRSGALKDISFKPQDFA